MIRFSDNFSNLFENIYAISASEGGNSIMIKTESFWCLKQAKQSVNLSYAIVVPFLHHYHRFNGFQTVHFGQRARHHRGLAPAGMSTKIIAEHLTWSWRAVSRYLKDSKESDMPRGDKRYENMSFPDKQNIIINKKKRATLSTSVHKDFNRNVTYWIVCQILSQQKNLKYDKLKNQSALRFKHI